MSLLMRAARAALRLRPNVYTSAETARASASSHGEDLPPPRWLRRRFAVDVASTEGRRVVTVAPRRAGGSGLVVYLHGGGYIHGTAAAHWAIVADLVRRSGATVTLPCYRLAPGATLATELPFLRSVYDQERERGPVVLAGDSAGGALALGLAIELRDTQAALPSGLVLFAPWLDATMSNPAIPALTALDPMLAVPGLVWAGRAWAGDGDPAEPRISALSDHLRGLPPLFVYQGGHDIFACDAERFAAKARSAGAACVLRRYPDGFHVFMGLPWLPESRDALRHAAAVIRGEAPERPSADADATNPRG